MSKEQYWIGKNIDYQAVWRDFDAGVSYIEKFRTMESHLLRITLANPSKELPLFNHEAVFKTVKGYYHDLKAACLTPIEYDQAGPLYLYSVDRGSGIWDFLGQLRHLLLFGTTLADEKLMGERLANVDKKLDLLRKYFGNASVREEDFQAFMAAKTPKEVDEALQRLIQQGIQTVEVSTEPFTGDINATRKSLVDLRKIDMEG
jgi:hypothetical protein